MKKHLAAAVAAGLWFVAGCQESTPEPKTHPEGTAANVAPGTTPATRPTPLATIGKPAVPPQDTANIPPGTSTPVKEPWDVLVAGKPVYFRVRAEGVQIYEPKEAAGKWAWALKAPEALLYDEKGRAIGKHYGSPAGPTWEMGDGSKIVGKKEAEEAKPGSIPSLTISVKAHDGAKGKFTPIGFVKRVETDGGLAPSAAPTPEQVGKEERVPYRATYLFYAGK